MKGDKGRVQSGDWAPPAMESRTSQWETNGGRQVKTDIQRARHHQPDWETHDREPHEGRQVKTEPDWKTKEGGEVKADIRRAGRHQPGWETHELGDIHRARHIQTSEDTHPKSPTPPARLGDKWKETSEDTSKKQDTTSQMGNKWKETGGDTPKEEDTTSHTGRQMEGK